MTKCIFIAVAGALALTACGSGRMSIEGNTAFVEAAVRRPVANKPNVFVNDNKYLVIDQEPIHVKIKRHPTSGAFEPVTLLFALSDSPLYVFAPEDASDPLRINALKGSPAVAVSCGLFDANRVLSCTYIPPGKSVFSYTLRVRNTTTGDIILSDPSVLND